MSIEKQLYNTKIQQSVPDCHVGIEETDELCWTRQIQNVQDSCQISISTAWKHDVYEYIPTDQLSILLTPIPPSTLPELLQRFIYKTSRAKTPRSIFSGLPYTKQY